jgi:hypothetical protein
MVWVRSFFYPAVASARSVHYLRLGCEAVCGNVWRLELHFNFSHFRRAILRNTYATKNANDKNDQKVFHRKAYPITQGATQTVLGGRLFTDR